MVSEPIKAWLAQKKPDVLFVIYNDHVTSFFFDHYSAFCLGVGEEYAVADEGGGPRNLPPIKGHGALARHIGQVPLEIARFGDAWRMSCTGCGETSVAVEFRWQVLDQTVACRCE